MSFWDSIKKVATTGVGIIRDTFAGTPAVEMMRTFAGGTSIIGTLYRDAYNKIPEFRANLAVDVDAKIDAKIRLDSADIRQGLEAIGRGLDTVGLGLQTGLSTVGQNVGLAGSAIGMGMDAASARTRDGLFEIASALRQF